MEPEKKTPITKSTPISVFLTAEDKLQLKALSAAVDKSSSELVRMAVREFIYGYTLSPEQQAVYDSKIRSLTSKGKA